MATTIAQLAAGLQELFGETADRIARETQFVQRESALSGAAFAKALITAWLANPQASEEQLAQAAAAVGVTITAQGLAARFTRPAAELMRRLLEAAVGQAVAAHPAMLPILNRFQGVYIQDSTTITLPDALVEIWQGSGANRSNETVAGLKVQVQWDYNSGQLSQVVLQDGCAQDRDAPVQHAPLPAGALRLADLGYFSLPVLAGLSDAGVYWLSRPQINTLVWTADGGGGDLVTLLRNQSAAQVELAVLLGKEQRLPCRLLAVRVPQEVADRRRQALYKEARHKGQAVSQARLALADWTIMVTNAPAERLTLREALVVLGCRWQIELLFKLWKSHGQVDQSRSENPWRILTEVYAKLLAMVVQHWLFLVGHWSLVERSLFKAAQTIRSHAMHLAAHFDSVSHLEEAITTIARCLRAGCRINKSRTAPRTHQRLKALEADADASLFMSLQSDLRESAGNANAYLG
jgi:hypothetical protein